MSGTNHGDTITGSTAGDIIELGTGANLVYATAGNDTISNISTTNGTNTLSLINDTGASYVDLLVGGTSGFVGNMNIWH